MAKSRQQQSRAALLFILCAVGGIFSLVGMATLPLSEERNALVLGYSLSRWIIFLLHVLLISGFTWMAFVFLRQPDRALGFYQRAESFLTRRSLIGSAIFTLMAVWILGVLLLEVLLNPQIFPRAILYQFLYVRVRYPILWSLWVSVLSIYAMIRSGWIALPTLIFNKASKLTLIGMGGVLLVCLFQAGLWLYYGSIDPIREYADILTNFGFILLFVSLFLGLHLISWRRTYPAIKEYPGEEKRSEFLQKIETGIYLLLLGILVGLYVYSSYFVPQLPDPNTLTYATLKQVIFGFGFKQLQYIDPVFLVIWGVLVVTGLVLLRKYPFFSAKIFQAVQEKLARSPIYLYGIAGMFFLAAYLLRSNAISADMQIYMQWLPDQFSHGMIHVRFDEMWESNFHSTTYIILHTLFGWDVPSSYQIVACLSAPFFFVLLYQFARQLLPQQPLYLVMFLFTGGYIQLFFGDMEYYTISLTLVLAYFYSAYLYLHGRIAFPIPAMILGLGMSFHMEILYLLPTLVFLSIFEVERRSYITLLAGWLGLASYISLTILFFGYNGASLPNMRDTSWGLGRSGNVLANFMPFEWITFFARVNMVFVIFPLIAYLIAVIGFRRIHLSGFNGFLLVGTAAGIPFSFTWISTIGFYSDWNLFSMPMFPAIFLLGYNLIRNVKIPLRRELLFSMCAISGLVTYAWIVHNHLIIP